MEVFTMATIAATLNPLTHFTEAGYVSIWTMLFNTLLNGMWARLFAAAFLVLAFWFGVYRRLFGLGIILFTLCIVITYLGGVIGMMFWWTT